MTKAGTVVRKARVEEAAGKLVEYVLAHHVDSRGAQWDRMVFADGSFIDIPDESRYGTSFDIVIGNEYSARWSTLPNGRRGLTLVEGGQGFDQKASDKADF